MMTIEEFVDQLAKTRTRGYHWYATDYGSLRASREDEQRWQRPACPLAAVADQDMITLDVDKTADRLGLAREDAHAVVVASDYPRPSPLRSLILEAIGLP